MLIVGTVQGLVKEKKKVKDAFMKIDPDVVALPISDEMLDGLKAVVNGEVKEIATNSIDDTFADHLKRFGEVQLPPPSLVEAYRLAQEKDVEIVTVDMNEEDYAEAYTKHVSAFHFWRRIWSLSRLTKKTFVADTPEEFVVAWDIYTTRLRGYANLEKAREKYMAEKAVGLLKDHEKVLVLVEYERMEGVVKEIRKGTLELEKNPDVSDKDKQSEENEVDSGSEDDNGIKDDNGNEDDNGIKDDSESADDNGIKDDSESEDDNGSKDDNKGD